jgi:hypothetical protein
MKKLFLLLLFTLWAAPAWASWAHVQTTGSFEGADDNNAAQAYGSNVTAGSLLLASVTWHANTGQTISGCTDSLTQTWTQVGSTVTVNSDSGGDWSHAVFRFYNSAGGANTVTCTLSANTFEKSIVISEYSGIATTDALDQTAGQAQVDPGTATDAVTSTAVTTTANNELVYGASFGRCGGSSVLNSGTGFTSRHDAFDGVASCIVVEDKNLVSAGTAAATFTAGDTGQDNATIVATFKQTQGTGYSTPRGIVRP